MTASTTCSPQRSHAVPAFTLRLPEGEPLPLICDSPHSGTKYPDDFGYAVPFDLLRAGEDTDVHVLWDALPSVGATLLAAEFPRAYIDPEPRHRGHRCGHARRPLAHAAQPQREDAPGHRPDLARREEERPRAPSTTGKLPVAEVQSRIATYHAPYHAAMREHIEAAYARFGAVAPEPAFDARRLVRGPADPTTTRSPTSCWAIATAPPPRPSSQPWWPRRCRKCGFSVAINDPFKGVALIARLGRPAERRHSIQIEVHRGLYMNEITRERSKDFNALQDALKGVSQDIATYVKDHLK